MEHKVPGFELEDFALAASAQLIVFSFGTEMNTPNAGLKSWDQVFLSAFFKFPLEKPTLTNLTGITDKIKHAPWVNRILLWLDNQLGYGKYLDPESLDF